MHSTVSEGEPPEFAPQDQKITELEVRMDHLNGELKRYRELERVVCRLCSRAWLTDFAVEPNEGVPPKQIKAPKTFCAVFYFLILA